MKTTEDLLQHYVDTNYYNAIVTSYIQQGGDILIYLNTETKSGQCLSVYFIDLLTFIYNQ